MRPNRPRNSRPPARRPGGVVLPLVGGGLVLYMLCLGLFAVVHYDAGKRPRAALVMREFHAFLGIGPTQARAAAPEVKAALPPLAPKPVVPPPAPVVHEPSQIERIAQTLRKVEREAPKLRQHERDATFEGARIEVLSTLCDARDQLNEILDERPSDARANRLWDRLQELLAAVRKL